METKAEIAKNIAEYIAQFPEEIKRQQLVVQFVDRYEDDQLISRKNFDGHLTASAFILNKSADKILLLHHHFLNRWLQPGGHIDSTDASLILAALREAEEETGIESKYLSPVHETIFDIDSHHIPFNNKKNEPPHYHHDIRFVFILNNDVEILINDESHEWKWIPINLLAENEEFIRVADKINKLISTRQVKEVYSNSSSPAL